MENKNQPAFPIHPEAEKSIRGGYGFLEIGLTKREYFAGLAMQGLLTKYTLNKPEDQFIISKLSVELADELLKHLEL